MQQQLIVSLVLLQLVPTGFSVIFHQKIPNATTIIATSQDCYEDQKRCWQSTWHPKQELLTQAPGILPDASHPHSPTRGREFPLPVWRAEAGKQTEGCHRQPGCVVPQFLGYEREPFPHHGSIQTNYRLPCLEQTRQGDSSLLGRSLKLSPQHWCSVTQKKEPLLTITAIAGACSTCMGVMSSVYIQRVYTSYLKSELCI